MFDRESFQTLLRMVLTQFIQVYINNLFVYPLFFFLFHMKHKEDKDVKMLSV